MNATLWLAVVVITVSGLCDTITHVGFKMAADRVRVEVVGFRTALYFGWHFFRAPIAWLGITFSLISLLLFLYALTMADLSFAFSIDSIHHVFIALVSYLYLKEKVTWQRWLGTLCIMLGIVLVTLSGMS